MHHSETDVKHSSQSAQSMDFSVSAIYARRSGPFGTGDLSPELLSLALQRHSPAGKAHSENATQTDIALQILFGQSRRRRA